MDGVSPRATAIELAQLGEQLSPLRLRSPEAMPSLRHHAALPGPLTGVVAG